MSAPYGFIQLAQAPLSLMPLAKVATVYFQLNIQCNTDLKDNLGLLQVMVFFFFFLSDMKTEIWQHGNYTASKSVSARNIR